MGSVIPLKKSANSAYLDLKSILNDRLDSVEKLIHLKLKSDVELIKEMSDKLLQTIERNKLLHPILFEQEWGKDVRGMTRQ